MNELFMKDGLMLNEGLVKERKGRRKIINEEGLEVQEPGPRLPIH